MRFLFFLLVPFLAFSQVDVKTVPIIVGNGQSFSDAFEATSVSDLTNPANAGKVACISSDITLTANITLAQGMGLSSCGGKITGAFDVVGNGSWMVDENLYDVIIDANVTTISGDWRNGYYSANWFGLMDTNDSPLFDNFDILHEALDVVNSNGGTLELQKGYYYVSCTEQDAGSLNWFDTGALTIREGVHFKGSGRDNTVLRTLGNNLFDFAMLYPYARPNLDPEPTDKAINVKISDIWLHGEEMEHDYSVGGIQDRGHLIEAYGDVSVEVYNCKLTHAKADAIIWSTFADLGGASFTRVDFESGSLDTSTGATVANANFERTINYGNVTNYGIRNGYAYITGNSFGNSNIQGVFPDVIGVYFYNASNTFLEYAEVNSYERFRIPDTATKYKLVVETIPPDNVLEGAEIAIRFRTPLYSELGSKVHNNIFKYNRRNHISNLAPGTEVYSNQFLELGAQDPYWAGPGYAVGPEDGYGLLNGLNIHDNYFRNNIAGATNARFIKDYIFANNIIDRNANDTLVDGTVLDTDLLTTVGIADCENCQVVGGVYKNTNVNISQGNHASELAIYDGRVTLGSQSSSFSNSTVYNTNFRGSIDSLQTGVSYVSNIVSIVEKTDQVTPLQSLNNIVIDGFLLQFIDGVYFDNSPALVGDFGTATTGNRGSINNMRFVNVRASDANKAIRGGSFPAIPISNSKFTCGVFIGSGKNDTDVLRYKNNDFKWLRLELDHYPNGGIKKFPVEIIDCRISIDGDGNLISAGNNLFETPAKDIDLVVRDTKFIIDVAGENAFIELLHNGYTYFENCWFESVDALSMVLSTVAPNTDVTFDNCKFRNVTVTLKAGDQNNNPTNL